MLQFAFAFAINYSLLVNAIKISTLMLYRRIFTLKPGWFRIGWRLNLVYIFCYNIAILGGILNICKPIQSLWSINPPPGACPHKARVADMSFAALNGLGDLFILSLPIPRVWNLQMPPRKKIAICGIFLLGSLYVLFYSVFPVKF